MSMLKIGAASSCICTYCSSDLISTRLSPVLKSSAAVLTSGHLLICHDLQCTVENAKFLFICVAKRCSSNSPIGSAHQVRKATEHSPPEHLCISAYFKCLSISLRGWPNLAQGFNLSFCKLFASPRFQSESDEPEARSSKIYGQQQYSKTRSTLVDNWSILLKTDQSCQVSI